MNSNYIMSKSVRRLKKLVLYKNIKIFEYAINDVEDCENHELHLYVDLEKHVHTEGLKGEYVYELKYEIVRLKARRTV